MIIGLGYKAKSGKDVVADYLVSHYNFKKTAFAESLKKACKEIFHLTDEQLYGNQKEVVDKTWGVTPRYILQRVGTECMRQNYDDRIWIMSLGKRIFSEHRTNWVITDVRFPNEAEAIKEWEGHLVRVDRPEAGAEGGIEKHASEVSMDSFKAWDFTLHNDGTIDDLHRKVDNLMEIII